MSLLRRAIEAPGRLELIAEHKSRLEANKKEWSPTLSKLSDQDRFGDSQKQSMGRSSMLMGSTLILCLFGDTEAVQIQQNLTLVGANGMKNAHNHYGRTAKLAQHIKNGESRVGYQFGTIFGPGSSFLAYLRFARKLLDLFFRSRCRQWAFSFGPD